MIGNVQISDEKVSELARKHGLSEAQAKICADWLNTHFVFKPGGDEGSFI